MTAYLIVRAVVPEAERQKFDAWYQDVHLPEAVEAFNAVSAWRGWSHEDAAVHLAFYAFDSLADALAVAESDAMQSMRADFDRNWEDRVPRTREIVDVAQSLPA